jgi:ADP-ribosyl-[dinitrogen reductase] hydrolase
VEFLSAREIACRHTVHKDMVGGGWLHLRPGQVTDDTEMAMALGSAVIAGGRWDLRAIADAFVAWMRRGPVDIGNTCRRGLVHYSCSGNVCVPFNEGDCGNGAAMRHLPAVLASLHDEPRMLHRAVEQAHITHNHSVSDAAVSTLARLTRALVLQGGAAPCDLIAAELVSAYPQFNFRPWPGRTSGFIVHTVQTVFDGFFHTGSFEDCLIRVVNRGGDADTTGALAGQLAGALYGLDNIPSRWIKKLDPAVSTAIRDQVPRLLNIAAHM